MKRRNLILGLGSLSAAGAAGLGTGAFTVGSVDRDATVAVASEDQAYLAMEPSSGPNGAYATQVSANQIGLDFSKSNQTGAGGEGVNSEGEFHFDDVFTITNQATQTLYVWVNFSGGSQFDDSNVWLYPNADRQDRLNDGSNNVLGLTPGETANIGVHVDTHGVGTEETLTMTVRADTDKPNGSGAVDGAGDDFAVVTENPTESNEYGTLQGAIDNVSGSTIVVKPGTYTGTVDIAGFDDLTIRSDGDGAIVRPASTLNWGPETNFSGRTTGVRVVNSTGVTFENLTFDFEGINDTTITGLLFWESTGNLVGNIVKNMSNANDAVDITSYLGTNDPGSSSYSDASRARIEFRNNEFVETGRIGVNAEAVVENNTFETTDAGYAVDLGSESTGEIRNNVIHGYKTPFSTGAESGGIYIENAYPHQSVSGLTKNVLVENNEVYDCQYGVAVGNEWNGIGGDVDIEVTLTGNEIYNNTLAGVVVTDEDASAGSSVTLVGSENIVRNNTSQSGTSYGYRIFEFSQEDDQGNVIPGSEDDGNITVNLSSEVVSENDVGIIVESDVSSPTSFQSIAVTNSNIVNNATAVNNTVSNLTIDATNNWWGDAAGPGSTGPNNVTGSVDTGSPASSSYSL